MTKNERILTTPVQLTFSAPCTLNSKYVFDHATGQWIRKVKHKYYINLFRSNEDLAVGQFAMFHAGRYNMEVYGIELDRCDYMLCYEDSDHTLLSGIQSCYVSEEIVWTDPWFSRIKVVRPVSLMIDVLNNNIREQESGNPSIKLIEDVLLITRVLFQKSITRQLTIRESDLDEAGKLALRIEKIYSLMLKTTFQGEANVARKHLSQGIYKLIKLLSQCPIKFR